MRFELTRMLDHCQVVFAIFPKNSLVRLKSLIPLSFSLSQSRFYRFMIPVQL
jgi:hypothetical protein